MGGVQPGLDVDADTHLLGGADQDADLSVADLVPQRLAPVRVGNVVYPGDVGAVDAAFDEQVGECRVHRRRAVGVGDSGVAEHDLAGTGTFGIRIRSRWRSARGSR